ncbi:globoside alpha-1,3-N-acetylgalactosaminyltransferase 1-like [Periophthalmus magnuspinnatus]|uniref:globoside alpha-1,3-N-acetylgalactosaminyltransferase 1-like n=1 Tax=Periophthalmus magnuspinnatus TaxID=409849 RepID=UPI00145AF038|nr:globoside alpha-1,3-N-acetylgalactosaminyltransferase 1-like [Periophthalmus magnuspinnatus]
MATLSSGVFRFNRFQLLLSCSVLFVIIYLLQGRKQPPSAPPPGVSFWHGVPPPSPHSPALSLTSWGAPVVWAESSLAAGRRSRFLGTPLRVVLVTLVVGNYAPYLQRFISTAEEHFLASRPVTYYILTDNPRVLQPPPPLRPGKQLRVVHIAELPGWERLYLRRLPLLAEAMRDMVGEEGVDFVFCADVDLEFVGAVGEEVLDKLVGVAHAEFYGKTRSELPYERGESVAAVMDEEGEWYYTSELYGGTLSEMLGLTQRCSLLLLQDQAQGVKASAMEESYLNRCFIDHAPSCVLSPEYSGGGAEPRVRSRKRHCPERESDLC